MELTGINVPVRIGRAVVLPRDLVLAKPEGVLFVPAILAEEAISAAEGIEKPIINQGYIKVPETDDAQSWDDALFS